MQNIPLAERIRPKKLAEVIGQKHLIGENGSLKSAIENKHWAALGDLLFASHAGLRNLYEVSCEELDFMVEKAKEHIAVIGSRMMGGGFGGCTLNLIRNEAVEDFASAVNSAYQLKFGRPVSTYSVNISNGTHIIVA